MKRGRNRSFASQGKADEDGKPVKTDQPEYSPRLKCGHCGHIFVPVFQRTRPDGRKESYCKSCGKVYRKHEAEYEALALKSRSERLPANIV